MWPVRGWTGPAARESCSGKSAGERELWREMVGFREVESGVGCSIIPSIDSCMLHLTMDGIFQSGYQEDSVGYLTWQGDSHGHFPLIFW